MSPAVDCEFNKEFLLVSTLLYIESDDKLREENYDIFSLIFKNVIVAKNGEEAVSLFQEYKDSIDVILVEIDVPDMDPLKLVSSLREIDWELPLLITSSFDESNQFLKLIKYNITNYIAKPIQIRTTFKIIAQLIEDGQREQELKDREYELNQFMTIVDSINMVCEVDTTGKIIAANDLLLMTTGYSLDEILNKQHSQFSQEYDYQETEETVFEYVKKGKTWSGDCKKIDKNGEVYHTFSIIMPIFDSDGSIKKFVECATPTTKYKSEIVNLKKQIVSIKSNSFKAIMENKQSQAMHHELTKKYQERVDDSVNNEQQLIMELHEANKKIRILEEKLQKQAIRFEDFQSFHYEKVQEIVKKYQHKAI